MPLLSKDQHPKPLRPTRVYLKPGTYKKQHPEGEDVRLASCDANGAVVYPGFPMQPLGGFRSSGWQRAVRLLGAGRVQIRGVAP
jgi:hypothetical protein